MNHSNLPSIWFKPTPPFSSNSSKTQYSAPFFPRPLSLGRTSAVRRADAIWFFARTCTGCPFSLRSHPLRNRPEAAETVETVENPVKVPIPLLMEDLGKSEILGRVRVLLLRILLRKRRVRGFFFPVSVPNNLRVRGFFFPFFFYLLAFRLSCCFASLSAQSQTLSS